MTIEELNKLIKEELEAYLGEDGVTLIDVNKQLIEEGHAVEYYGGNR